MTSWKAQTQAALLKELQVVGKKKIRFLTYFSLFSFLMHVELCSAAGKRDKTQIYIYIY